MKGTWVRDHVDLVLDQWRRERPDLDPTPVGIVGRISRAARLLEARLEPVFEQHDLSGWEFDVLATLRRSGEPYTLSAGTLRESSMITTGAMTNRLDRLEARGLVRRVEAPEDRRRVMVELTPHGRAVVDAALADHLVNETELVSALSPEDREQLAATLRELVCSLGDAPGA